MNNQIKTLEEVKEYYTNNPKETEKLKKHYSEKYNDDYTNWENEKFINWRFVDYGFYKFLGYIEISKDLIKNFNDVLFIENKPYIVIKIYEDTESNLNLFSLHLNNYKMHLHTLNNANLIIDSLNNKVQTLEGFVEERSGYKEKENKYLRTLDNFYGNYEIEGNQCCLASISKLSSNLDLWTIHLGGTDDYSISKDFIGKDKAYEEFGKLSTSEYVLRDDLEDYYFSN